MNIIPIILIIFIVPAILNLLSTHAKRNSKKTKSLYEFEMRPTKEISMLGWLCSGVFLFFIILSVYVEQFDGFVAAVFLTLLGLGILLILAPVRGFCDEIVNNDRITARRLWIFRRTVYISDIDHCKITRGGIHIYTKGSKIRKMSIDSMSINADNWMQRMEQENIPIIVKGTLQG